jgi:hypothetical protein
MLYYEGLFTVAGCFVDRYIISLSNMDSTTPITESSARQESAPATLKFTFKMSFVILQEQGKLETPIMTAAVD